MLKATTIIEMKKAKEEEQSIFCFFYYAFCFQVSFVNFYTIFFLLYISLSRKHIYNIQDNMFSNFIPPSDFFYFFLSYAVLRFLASYIEHNEIIKNVWNSNFSSKNFLRCLNYSFRFKWNEKKKIISFLSSILFQIIKSRSGTEV